MLCMVMICMYVCVYCMYVLYVCMYVLYVCYVCMYVYMLVSMHVCIPVDRYMDR